ncbi:MAG: trimethylamine--corrinoid protein Co-methyltransferase [Parasphingorhabdus sp.]|jgi:trimethylamine--corrinoid protein Co-methyltransferase
MTEPTRKRRRSRINSQEEALAAPAIRQIPRTKIQSPFPPLEPLSVDQLEAVHDASMRLLEEQGLEVMSAEARKLFREAGAEVDESTCMVKGDRELFLQAVAKAPHTFTLTPRNADNSVEIGGNVINFGFVSGPPNVHDRINGRRPGNFADYKKLISLAQYFNCITVLGNQTLAPIDLPVGTRHLDTYRENLLLTDKVWSAIPIGVGRIRDALEMVAIGRGQTVDELKNSPAMLANINVNSPRKLDDTMADAAIYMARHGQPVIVTPFTLMGAMTPVTMAGALAQQNAEALLTLAMLQLASPGAPVIYGGFTSNVDMRSGAPAFGTPENALANIIGGQLARRYGLPYRTSACNASNDTDAQAVYETSNALWGAVLGHGNVIYHSAGWMEGGLVASFEKVIIDVESLQAMTRMLTPVTVNESEFGLDAIREVGPGGHFFGVGHTMERYKTAFYEPFLSDWQNNESWQEAGAKSAPERATEIWQKILAEFEPPELEQSRREALDAYIAIRKEEIGVGDP